MHGKNYRYRHEMLPRASHSLILGGFDPGCTVPLVFQERTSPEIIQRTFAAI
jgi:hypothetical protein